MLRLLAPITYVHTVRTKDSYFADSSEIIDDSSDPCTNLVQSETLPIAACIHGEGSVYRRGDIWHFTYRKAGKRIRVSSGSRDRAVAERLLKARRTEVAPVVGGEINHSSVEKAISVLSWHARSRGLVYVARPENFGFVKIGTSMSLGSLKQRMCSLQSASPVDFEILSLFHGDREIEGELHKCFRKFKAKREWFYFTPTIEEFLKRSTPLNYFSITGTDPFRTL